jgi:hypothetical protein
MSEVEEDAVVETDAEAVVDDAPAELSAEDRALAMGWTPQGQFKGDPAKWVDAETFVKRGEEFLPFLKANNKRLEQALERQSKETAKLKTTLEKFGEYHSKTEARVYAQALKDLQAEQAAAVEANDLGAVQEITGKIVELNKDAAGPKADDAPGGPPKEWIAENKWYETDRVMRGAAFEIAQEMADQGKSPDEQLAEVAKRIRVEFPHKFENPNRRQAAAVEGSGSVRVRSGKTYADLPADAKQMCDEFCRDIPGFTRDKYVKDYAWEQSK